MFGSASPKLIMARSTSKLHQEAGYMSELRFRSLNSLDGGEASIYVLVIRDQRRQAPPKGFHHRHFLGRHRHDFALLYKPQAPSTANISQTSSGPARYSGNSRRTAKPVGLMGSIHSWTCLPLFSAR